MMRRTPQPGCATHRKGETRTAGRDLPDLAHRSLFVLACVPCAAGSLPYDTTPPFVWKVSPPFPTGSAPKDSPPCGNHGAPYRNLKISCLFFAVARTMSFAAFCYTEQINFEG